MIFGLNILEVAIYGSLTVVAVTVGLDALIQTIPEWMAKQKAKRATALEKASHLKTLQARLQDQKIEAIKLRRFDETVSFRVVTLPGQKMHAPSHRRARA